MNGNWSGRTVGSIVSEIPAASGIFKEYGIDYCCGGGRLLSQAAEEQTSSLVEIEARLDAEYEKIKRNINGVDFKSLSRGDLSSYIESKHHAYLREALAQIGGVFSAVLKAHGRNHPELFDLFKVFSGLRGDLEQHLIKEETMLFPSIGDAISSQTRELSRMIKQEHEEAGKALKELRRISNDYSLPEDACPTYQKLFALLEDMESDLHQHIHLENNILLADI